MSEIKFKNFDHTLLIEKQQQLFADCFPEVFDNNFTSIKYSTEKYSWQYQSFPSSPSSYEYIALIEDELVGYYASLPYVYKLGNEIVKSGMVCGVMTSPNHRKSGIFSKLGSFAAEEQKKEGVAFNLTFPIRKAVMPGFIRMGWEKVFEMPLYMKFLKVSSLLKKKKLSFFTPIFNSLFFIYNSFFKKKNNKNIDVVIYDQFENLTNYEEFIKIYEHNTPNTLKKDSTFSKWRYGSPDAKYLFFCAYKHQKLIGFVSLRPIIREGVPSYGILDFMSIDNICLSNLHNAITDHAKANKIEAIMIMMSKTSAKKYKLFSNGFLKSPFKFHFIIKNLSNKISKEVFFDENSWHLMFVDSDDL